MREISQISSRNISYAGAGAASPYKDIRRSDADTAPLQRPSTVTNNRQNCAILSPRAGTVGQIITVRYNSLLGRKEMTAIFNI